jgi:hypothetical protein
MANEPVEFDDARTPARVPAVREPKTEAAQILAMIAKAAANPDVDVAKFEKILELRQRIEDAEAKKAFNAAISDAKSEIGPIIKDKVVDFPSKKTDGRTNYRYEGFDTIARAVDPVLTKYGLSYRFRSTQAAGTADTRRLVVTCILSHRDGYSEETTLEAFEDHSGNKNSIQAVGSSATYLQRYTLKLALGLSVTTDDDGKASGQAPQLITGDQVARLKARMTEVGADEAGFLKFLKVSDFSDVYAVDFDKAMMALDAKAKKDGSARQ